MKETICKICDYPIKRQDAVVRVTVEAVRKKPKDKMDPQEWSDVFDWETPVIYHLECVSSALFESIRFPCDELCGELPMEDLAEEESRKEPVLKPV